MLWDVRFMVWNVRFKLWNIRSKLWNKTFSTEKEHFYCMLTILVDCCTSYL